METHMLVIRDTFCKEWMTRLDALSIQYYALHGRETVLMVKLQTEEEVRAYNAFLPDFMAFEEQLRATYLKKQQKKLARKNRFRRLTFRKPLLSLRRF
jgi:hypothetical protein